MPYLVTSEYGLCSTSTVSFSPLDSYLFLWYLQSNFKRNISVSKHHFVQRRVAELFQHSVLIKGLRVQIKFQAKETKQKTNFHHLSQGRKYQLKSTDMEFCGKPVGEKVLNLINTFSQAAEMFIFKYKEICIYDHYAPFTPSVTPDKTTFMFLPMSSTRDITSGFFQYGNSASSAALPRSTFSKIIHNARQT